MGYSSLASYKCFTTHRWLGRMGYKISAIAIHHMAGNLSVEQCGKVFLNNDVSAHYGIGNDGRIGVYVDENNSSWSMGSAKWNRKVISIELANCSGAPDWKVSDKVIERCIELVADIAYRNGWTSVDWGYGTLATSDIIAHKWVASTACPGPYMMNTNKLKYIANEADKKLKAKRANKSTSKITLTVDGKWGTNTSKRFQQYLGVTQDGIFGTNSTKAMQRWLGVTADGIMGTKTIKALQKKVGATVDGVCGINTVKALQRYLNNH